MKKILCLLSAAAFSLSAAEPPATNAPAAKNEVAAIPDAARKPVLRHQHRDHRGRTRDLHGGDGHVAGAES